MRSAGPATGTFDLVSVQSDELVGDYNGVAVDDRGGAGQRVGAPLNATIALALPDIQL
jgi:hypothetical protein